MGKDGRKHVAQCGEVGSEHAKFVFGQAFSEPAGERGKNIETGTVGHGRLRGFSIMICGKSRKDIILSSNLAGSRDFALHSINIISPPFGIILA